MMDDGRGAVAVAVPDRVVGVVASAVSFAHKLEAAGEPVADPDALDAAHAAVAGAPVPDGGTATFRLAPDERAALVAAVERFLEEVGGDRAAALRTALDALEAARGATDPGGTGGAGVD